MHKYTAPAWARIIYDVSSKLTEDFGGGPKQLKMARVTYGGAVMTYLDDCR